VDPGAGHPDSFGERAQRLTYRPTGWAGLIARTDIMFGGRTPHRYHMRPGMVSRSSDGNPHGKPLRVDTGRDVLRATPGPG